MIPSNLPVAEYLLTSIMAQRSALIYTVNEHKFKLLTIILYRTLIFNRAEVIYYTMTNSFYRRAYYTVNGHIFPVNSIGHVPFAKHHRSESFANTGTAINSIILARGKFAACTEICARA